jgi:hypothetical protein
MVRVKVLPGCAISDNGIRKTEGIHSVSNLADAIAWEKGGHLIILNDSPEIQEALKKPEPELPKESELKDDKKRGKK